MGFKSRAGVWRILCSLSRGEGESMNISWILSVIALVLAILSLIGMAGFAALPLAVLCLALAHVLPGMPARVKRW
jgi:hypothetical protein